MRIQSQPPVLFARGDFNKLHKARTELLALLDKNGVSQNNGLVGTALKDGITLYVQENVKSQIIKVLKESGSPDNGPLSYKGYKVNLESPFCAN